MSIPRVPDTWGNRSSRRIMAGWLAGESGLIVFGIDAGQGEGSDPLLDVGQLHHLRPVTPVGRENIWDTIELHAIDVSALADDARSAGSDRALLVADLAQRPSSESGSLT